jgi:hypothetical protein
LPGKLQQIQTLIEEIQNEPAELVEALQKTAVLLSRAAEALGKAGGLVSVIASASVATGQPLYGLPENLAHTYTWLRQSVASVETTLADLAPVEEVPVEEEVPPVDPTEPA